MAKQYHSVAPAMLLPRAPIQKMTGLSKTWWSGWIFPCCIGIDHFFVYTFKGTEDAVKEVLLP